MDHAHEEVDLVLIDQLTGALESLLGVRRIVFKDELDRMVAHLVADGVEVELEAGIDVATVLGLGARGRVQDPDLDRRGGVPAPRTLIAATGNEDRREQRAGYTEH